MNHFHALICICKVSIDQIGNCELFKYKNWTTGRFYSYPPYSPLNRYLNENQMNNFFFSRDILTYHQSGVTFNVLSEAVVL